jgi:hypothetical protein
LVSAFLLSGVLVFTSSTLESADDDKAAGEPASITTDPPPLERVIVSLSEFDRSDRSLWVAVGSSD